MNWGIWNGCVSVGKHALHGMRFKMLSDQFIKLLLDYIYYNSPYRVYIQWSLDGYWMMEDTCIMMNEI